MLQKCSTYKTLEIFFICPTKEQYLTDISKKVRLAHTSVRNNLHKLIKEGIITQRLEVKGNRKFPLYKANESSKFRKLKMLYNISSILESGIIEFIEEKLTPKSIVLFGSFARGEDDETSDIDLFVECKAEGIGLKDFERRLNRKIELHFNEKFSTYPEELRDSIINGIVISGFLEYHDDKNNARLPKGKISHKNGKSHTGAA